MKQYFFLNAFFTVLICLSAFPLPVFATESSTEVVTESSANTSETSAPETLNFCSPEVFDSLIASLADGAKKSDVFRLTDDGVIEVTGTHIGYLATPKCYRNFTLRGEYSLKDAQTNGGLLARITKPTATYLPRCVEIQVMNGKTGDLFGFHDLTISGGKDRFESGKNHKMVGNYCWIHTLREAGHPKIDDWNTIEVTCFDDLILVRVNGQIVNWAYDVEKACSPAAIQSEDGPIRWRNLQLIEER